MVGSLIYIIFDSLSIVFFKTLKKPWFGLDEAKAFLLLSGSLLTEEM